LLFAVEKTIAGTSQVAQRLETEGGVAFEQLADDGIAMVHQQVRNAGKPRGRLKAKG
jgi:hypothetical protein